jgi:hypothetical protein
MANPTTKTENYNPDWIRAVITSALISLLVKAVLHIPFFVTFSAFGIIFLLHVLRRQMGSSATTAWEWIKEIKSVVVEVIVFLAIRYLVGMALNLYPSDTLSTAKQSGGLWEGIILARNVSGLFMLEVTLAFIIGQITVKWGRGTTGADKFPVRAVIVVSCLVLVLQHLFPKYIEKTWPTKEKISARLERNENGVLGTPIVAAWRLAWGPPAPRPVRTPSTTLATTVATTVPQVVQLPDHTTPCTIDIKEIRDLYTDGYPIWALPPGWPEEKKIFYSGRGHVIVQGGDIHSGTWKFWSADTNKTAVMIRIFALQ